MWFSIPLALATSLGLAVRAFDLPLSADEGNAGLVPPAAAYVLLGKHAWLLDQLQFQLAVANADGMLLKCSTCSLAIVTTVNLGMYCISQHACPPLARQHAGCKLVMSCRRCGGCAGGHYSVHGHHLVRLC